VTDLANKDVHKQTDRVGITEHSPLWHMVKEKNSTETEGISLKCNITCAQKGMKCVSSVDCSNN